MPTIVATFYQLQDDEVNLAAAGGGLPDKVTLKQSVTVTPALGEGALVSWVARRLPGSIGSVTYTVTLNSNGLGTYTTSSDERIGIQEATDTNFVIRGDNELVFQVFGGTATLLVGDVMLWHRVRVD